MTLAQLQSQLQNAIRASSVEAIDRVNTPPRGTAEQALAIYQNAYTSRLTEFLAHDFEVLRQYLGEVRFTAMAAEYIATHPSRHPNARWYSSQLPDFLTGHPDAPPELLELATLERAFADAFDAVEAPVIGKHFLTEVPPESVHNLAFKIHPSFHSLSFSQNTSSIWSALKCGEAPPECEELDAPQQVIVWRQAQQSRMRILGYDEYMAVTAVKNGATFGVVCEMLAMRDQEENVALRAATYLRGWLEAEILSEATWDAPEK
jgi:hypothetical protein